MLDRFNIMDSTLSKNMSRTAFFILFLGIPSVLSARGQRVLSSPDIPLTQFSCTGRPPGYYADVETGCQVYHMCTEGGNQFSYRCPITTLFQQRMLICAHSYQVNCNRSDQYFSNNLLIGQKDKPFVNDDPIFFSKEKEIKTLQNPEALQDLGQTKREDSPRQGKSHSPNENNLSNRVFQNFKRDRQPHAGLTPTNGQFPNTFPTTPPGPTQFQNSFSTPNSQFFSSFSPTNSPINLDRTQENLSSLPLAGSVIPGGVKNFQSSQATRARQTFQTTTPSFKGQSTTVRTEALEPQRTNQPVFFFSPTPTPNTKEKENLFVTTKTPVNFSPKISSQNNVNLQPIGFRKPNLPGNTFVQDSSTSNPSFEFQPPISQQHTDLVMASQENAVESRRSTTPPSEEEDFGGVSLPETDVKAVIEQTRNGSLPDDRFNTFIKRFNPYEEPPKSTETSAPEQETEKEYHTFINRFVPDDRPLEGKIVTGYNLEEIPGDHVFINRFVLLPEEIKQDKSKHEVDRLHSILAPTDQLTVNFPNFDLSPPAGEDSDNSESNKIELQFQDPRSAFFIPSGDGSDFSKADAAPILITIPLHSSQRTTQMLFRKKDSQDSCSKCHPSFIVNKDTCTPCVIIR